MSLAGRVLEAVSEAVDETNQHLPESQHLDDCVDTVLFGPGGRLDSLGLVNFVTEVEEKIEDHFDLSISLADEKALSQKRSPFHSVQTLVDYIVMLVEENQ